MPNYTPTERALLTLLSDGLPHTKAQLKACMIDDMADWDAVYMHIIRLREKLPDGQTILPVAINRRIEYRMVRLINGVTPTFTL